MAYTKYKDPWLDSDLRSGEAMNHLESQWTSIKADADIHNHDTRYYTKTLADTTFFSTSFYTGFDADKIDGSHFSDLVAAILPVGAIMIWHDTDATIPTGWAICNGGSSTPDLRDKFVIGAGSTYSIGDTGGSLATKAITGSVTIDAHTLVGDEMPLHTHDYTDIYETVLTHDGFATSSIPVGNLNNDSRTTSSAGGGGPHGHSGSTVALDNISATQAYYALYYIMKVA